MRLKYLQSLGGKGHVDLTFTLSYNQEQHSAAYMALAIP